MTQLAQHTQSLSLEEAEATLDLSSLPNAPWTLDVLQGLCDQSLVRTFERGGTRFCFARPRDAVIEVIGPVEPGVAGLRIEPEGVVVGPGGAAVAMDVRMDEGLKPIYNVLATIKGDGEPERQIAEEIAHRQLVERQTIVVRIGGEADARAAHASLHFSCRNESPAGANRLSAGALVWRL